MEKLRGSIGPADVVLAAVLSGLGIWLMVENTGGSQDGTRIDSTTSACSTPALVAISRVVNSIASWK